ncbi:MAG: class I SAM-dependent methyltransferase [Stellaceae bacterium]
MNGLRQEMKTAWNERAAHDPFRYVETAFWDGNIDKFFALGEERARTVIDPVLAAYGIPAAAQAALDLGCGVGRFSRALAGRFDAVAAIDVSDGMIQTALDANRGVDNLRFFATDGLFFPLDEDSVDFVFSYEVLQHMPSHDVIAANLRETARVLRPGGRALIHFKTAYDDRPILNRLLRALPDWAAKRVRSLGKRDAMTSDAAFRGAPPLPRSSIARLCEEVGLAVVEFRGDPTHTAGTRVFALLQHEIACGDTVLPDRGALTASDKADAVALRAW